jgi:hypothetical protein
MRTKTFSAQHQPKQLDKPTAWACLLTNLMVPGLGTFVAGRRLVGVVQIIVAQLGFVLTLIWGAWFIAVWIGEKQFPENVGPYFGYAVAGAILFLISWSWALRNSISTLRKAQPPKS